MPSKLVRVSSHRKKSRSTHAHLNKSRTTVVTEQPKKPVFWKGFIISVLVILFSFVVFYFQGASALFWAAWGFGGLVFLVNTFWYTQKYATPFVVPLLFTMLKTQKLTKLIYDIAHKFTFMEKIAFIGLFVGFGLTWVDYWKARKLGGWKRVLLLGVFALILGGIYYLGLGWMFSVPALAPLFLFCGIAFVVLGFGGMSLALMIGYGVLAIIAFFEAKQICPAIAPVIPGVPIPGLGNIIPLIGWVSLGLILVIHEMSHGVLLAYYGKKIKSVGLLLAGIFPVGAFVEEDAKELDKSNDNQVLMMLSAGPSSNLFTMFIGIAFIFILGFVLSPVAGVLNAETNKMYDGVVISGVEDTVSYCGITHPAPAKGLLLPGDELVSVNGISSTNLVLARKEILTKDDVNIVVNRNGVLTEVIVNPVKFSDLNVQLIGVSFSSMRTSYEPPIWVVPSIQLLSAISTILIFFVLLSFAVGMFNFLPADPLDGGKMAKIILEPYCGFMKFKSKEETRKFIGRIFIWTFLLSLLVNFLPYLGIIF